MERNKQNSSDHVSTDVLKPKWKPPVYIIAGDYHQAKFLARANQIPKEEWRYIPESWDLQGARGQIVFYGTWARRSDAHKIADLVDFMVAEGRLERIELSDKPD